MRYTSVKTSNQYETLVEEREALRAELNDLGTGPGYSREFLDHLSEIDGELGELCTKTEAFERIQLLEQAKTQAASNYNRTVERALSYIQDTLNQTMEEISKRVVGPEYNPPILTINGYNSFRFNTPHDGRYRYRYRMPRLGDLRLRHAASLQPASDRIRLERPQAM